MSKYRLKSKNSWNMRFRSFKRRRLLPIWKEVEWPFLVAVWFAGLILSYIGFARYSMMIGDDSTSLDFAYRTLRLIGTRSGDLEGSIPWQLEIARFSLPAVAAYTALKGLFSVFRNNWQLFKLRYLKDHVIICGLGNRGFRLVQEFFEQGYKVVIVEADEANSLIDQCREQVAAILIGNATDQSVLDKARLHKAKYLIAVCRNDEINADIASQIIKLDHKRKGSLLTAFIHIVDGELCNLLKSQSFSAGKNDSFSLEFFNVQDRGARLMLRNHPPFDVKFDYDREEKQPRILVVGLGKMGRSLVVQVAQNWWMKGPGKIKEPGMEKKFRVTVIDEAAERKLERLLLQYPQLEQACDISPLSMDMDSPEFERGDYLFDSRGLLDTDIIYICLDDDVQALVNSLTLYKKTKNNNVPVVVQMSRDAGLAGIIKKEQGDSDFGDIKPFGILEKTCSLEAIMGGTVEMLARAFHEDYLSHQKEEGKSVVSNPSMVEWEELPEDLKESNRQLASHVSLKLKAVGYEIQPLIDWDSYTFEFSPQEIEYMAEQEHERWCEERLFQGWTYKAGPKDIGKKTSPSLIPWERLSEEEKDKDRNNIKSIPLLLAKAGFQVSRKS